MLSYLADLEWKIDFSVLLKALFVLRYLTILVYVRGVIDNPQVGVKRGRRMYPL